MKYATLAAALLMSTAANAYSVNVTTADPGDITLMNLDGSIGLSYYNTSAYNGSFMGTALIYAASDQVAGERLAPGAQSAYFAAEPGASQVLIVGGVHTSFALELFTLDDYNSITFDINGPDINHNANITFTGAQLASFAGITADGASTVWATFTDMPAFTGVEFNTTQIAEEFIPGSVTSAPEASTWVMMLTGFAFLGYAALDKRKRAKVVV